MTRIFYDEDADLGAIQGQTIAVIGYGNQGRAQALNIRDSGLRVVIGNVTDSYADQAAKDDFDVLTISAAAECGDVVLLLLPDEVVPRLFDREIRPRLRAGACLCVASGYNLYYGRIDVPANLDVIMVAPRMVGLAVRAAYQRGAGFPSLIAVHHDSTGTAMTKTLAIAKAIGSTRVGAVLSSIEEETVTDLFDEHLGHIYAVRRQYDVLREAGYSPEAILLELYMSGEREELLKLQREVGLFDQLVYHSRTAQYGQEVTARLSDEDEAKERARLKALLANIKNGKFARDWALEQREGERRWRRIHGDNLAHPLVVEEQRLRARLRRQT